MKSRVSGKALEGAPRRGKVPSKGRGSGSTSEVRFRRLFESAKDGILILDASTHEILEVNPYFAGLIELPREQIQFQQLEEIGIFPDKETLRGLFDKLQTEGFVQFEHSIARQQPGGASRELEFVCNKYLENGRALIQCNVRDIGQRKESDRQLREALHELAEAKQQLEQRVQERTADLQQRNAELEAFSYSLSHDLRAPIRAIVSFTQLAIEKYGKKAGAPATDYLQKAVTSAQRLDRLILDVLAFSRTSHNTFVPEHIDTDQLLREILQERPEWNPPVAEVILEGRLLPVLGDRASMTQCLTNLLDNAVKFVPPGTPPQIRVSTDSVGSRVRLCVADNGIGIPAAAQPRIFELFQRAHNGYEGHGIGLAIVRRAVERMRGSISVSSSPGEGSTFCVELPSPNSV
jgi:PAS domain S-box-containing protein